MSDVTVAPEGGSASEVVINEQPVNIPNPVGSQTPIEERRSDPTAEGRREAIQRAFERASNPKDAKPTQRPPPKPAEAKPGHNQPPEETPKLDLKQRPDNQPAPRHREQGRFARAPDAQQQPQRPRSSPLPETAPYREPPPRMAEHAKADWGHAPESVRGEFHRLAKEADGIYRQYRGAHDAFRPIAHFHDMAVQHGTTLERALTNYVTMEQKLRADPIGGLDVIVNNLNLCTPEGQKLTLRDIAYHVLSQSPDQLRLMQTNNAQSAASHQIGALHQEIAGLKNHLAQMHTHQQFSYARSAVDHFADAHPRFDELGELIEREVQLGFDLDTAYKRAELLRPTHAAQTRAPPAQTRTVDRSISGSPDVASSNGASRRSEKPVERRTAISNAIRRVSGGL
jgi:hypothetical protein